MITNTGISIFTSIMNDEEEPKEVVKLMQRFKSVSKFDWLLFAGVALLCFLTFQQGDLFSTAGWSIALLNGHILDFYEYHSSNYMLSSYILFAIWNIPIRLLGWVQVPTKTDVGRKVFIWYKLCPTVFYLLSGFVFYKILQKLNVDEKKAKIGTFIFLSSPIGFFSQFIFGQYDSFTLFFMLLGIYYWLTDDRIKFSLFFGLSFTFKYTSFLIFMPLLLLREKRYRKIILSSMLAGLPLLIEAVPYLFSEQFAKGVIGFGAVGYVASTSITATNFPIAIVIVLWILICGFAFFQTCSDKVQLYKWAIYLSSMVCFVMFGLCQWHPQWLLFMVPFLTLGMIFHERGDTFLIIDLLMMILFTLVTVTVWPNHLDQKLFQYGIFRNIFENAISAKGSFELTMVKLLHVPKLVYSFSAFCGVLLVATLFKHPKYMLDHVSDKTLESTGLIRLRFIGGVAFFVIPAVICFGALFTQADVIVNNAGMNATLDAMTEESDVRQYFTADDSTLSEVRVAVGTYMQENHGELIVSLYEASSDTLLAETTADISKFEDNSYCTIDFPETSLHSSEQYYLRFGLRRESGEDLLTIYRTAGETASDTNYAVVNGEITDYNLCVNLYGETG